MAADDFYYEPWQLTPTITVHESDKAPQPIGILDQHGVMIHRIEKRVPFGFQPPAKDKPARRRR